MRGMGFAMQYSVAAGRSGIAEITGTSTNVFLAAFCGGDPVNQVDPLGERGRMNGLMQMSGGTRCGKLLSERWIRFSTVRTEVHSSTGSWR